MPIHIAVSHAWPRSRAFRAGRYAFLLLLLTLVYVIAGKLGLALATVHPSVSAIWPASGIATAVFGLSFFAHGILALRFRPLGISLGLFAHFAIAVWGTSRGFGSYARMPEGYLLLQLYMATRVFFFQLPAVLTIVRQRAIEDLRASRQRIHDFNNLLTTVNGYSDLILHAPPGDASIPDHAREIRAAGTRAADLTLQLLTFSRQDVVQPLVFDLNGLVADRERWLVSLLCDGFHLGLTLAGSEGDCSRPGAQGPGE